MPGSKVPISPRAVAFITTATVTRSLTQGLRTFTAVPRSTQSSTLHETEYQLSGWYQMAMADICNTNLHDDWQLKSVGFVWVGGLHWSHELDEIHEQLRSWLQAVELLIFESRVNALLTHIVKYRDYICRELCENGWTDRDAVWNAE